MPKTNPAKFADFTKSNQAKLSPEMALKAKTEKHPNDTTPAPEPEKVTRREPKRVEVAKED